MADGFTIEIDEDLARRIERAAEKVGMSREDFARLLLDQQTFNVDDYAWLNGDPREATTAEAAAKDARGWEEVRPELLALLDEKLRGRE